MLARYSSIELWTRFVLGACRRDAAQCQVKLTCVSTARVVPSAHGLGEGLASYVGECAGAALGRVGQVGWFHSGSNRLDVGRVNKESRSSVKVKEPVSRRYNPTDFA